jgi:hypothetical protein
MDLASIHWPRWRARRTREHRPVSRRVLLAWGWVAVALLFGLYVAVLHHAVQRADRMRSEQLSASVAAHEVLRLDLAARRQAVRQRGAAARQAIAGRPPGPQIDCGLVRGSRGRHWPSAT